MKLKNYDLVNEDALSDVDQVKGVFLANDQYQVIFGSGTVNLVTAEVLNQTGLGASETKVEEAEEKKAIRSCGPSKCFLIFLFRSFQPS